MRSLARKISFGDLPLFLYFVAFLRECFWLVPDNYVAWPLTITAAGIAWYFYIRTRVLDEHRLHPSFWFIVGLPLLFLFSTRVAYPDTSFDVMTYHLVHAERALRGPLYIPGDIFFGQPWINPAPDILTGMMRYILGFRAGVVINLISLLWLGTVIDRILALRVSSAWLRSGLVLACLACEFLLGEINNYLVDLLALPLLMEALWLVLRPSLDEKSTVDTLPHFMLLIGMAVGLKLTSTVFALPICVLLIYRMSAVDGLRPTVAFRHILRFAALALAPMLVFAAYTMYRTGNPVFPLYNAVFRSPLLGTVNFYDGRYGPHGIFETIIWPVKMFLVPERLSELNMYTGRITIGCVLAILGLLLGRKDWRLGGLCFTMLVGAFLWSESSGYIRYGLFLEPLAGVLCVFLATALIERSGGARRLLAYGCTAIVGIALFAQCYRAAVLSYDHEWSGRVNCFRRRGCKADLAQLFRDRTLPLDDNERRLLANVDVWVESTPKTGGIMAVARPDVPGFTYVEEYYRGTGTKAEFRDSLERLRGKRFFTLVFREYMDQAQEYLSGKGFAVKGVDAIEIPYFSSTYDIPMFLIELEPPKLQDQ